MIIDPLKKVLSNTGWILLSLLVALILHDGGLLLYGGVSFKDLQHSYQDKLPRKTYVDQVPQSFYQPDSTKSGVAALGYLFSLYGDLVQESDLEYKWTRSGFRYSVEDLVNISKKRGYQLELMALSYEDFKDLQRPVIPILNNKIFVVLNEVDTDVRLFDPRLGALVTTSKEDFMKHWLGQVLVLRPFVGGE